MSRDPTINPYIVRALQNMMNSTQEKKPPQLPQMNRDQLKDYGRERMREMDMEEEKPKPYQRSPTHPVPVRSRDTADIGDDFNLDDFV
jgi:hypothetical protein